MLNKKGLYFLLVIFNKVFIKRLITSEVFFYSFLSYEENWKKQGQKLSKKV